MLRILGTEGWRQHQQSMCREQERETMLGREASTGMEKLLVAHFGYKTLE